MNSASLRELLEALKELREKLHGTVEPCVVQELDQIIDLLQEGVDESGMDKSKAKKILDLIGQVLSKLPAIATLIDLLSG